MKFPALFAVLVGATVATASADTKQEENNARISYNGKAATSKSPSTLVDGDVVELATPTPAKHGKEFITVGEDAGKFTQLRVDAHSGKVIVRNVRIEFTDGKVANITVDKILDKRKPSAMINVPKGPRAIEQIVVTTERQTAGSYSLHGIYGSSPGSTGVATR